MVSDIDQFGRDTSKNNIPSLNEEKSKKILESLAEIKNQLENKDYNPNVDDSSPKIKISNSKNKTDFDDLKSKIVSLEKKLNSIDTFLSNMSNNFEIHEPISQKLDGNLSIFHQIDSQSSIKQNKSLLVLEKENDLHKSNFNLFRFIMTINFLFFVLIGLIVYIKNIPLKDILKIF
mgnify:CR=1 FL=1|tara:strand:+ start:120 stop:647 length:528 start_codon:yes stop_codon:yes gene_type:complete